MSDAIDPIEISDLDRTVLEELEPEVGRLVERHLKVAQEWFPHEYIPYGLGRDYDKEPWTPDQPRLTGVAQTAFEIGLLTEDNLPSYHRLIHGMFGKGDGAWMHWVGRWTA
ncbi:MAG TPA: acyl-ACP desaturase, partial [Candidatus Limnocylindrales bacterium]